MYILEAVKKKHLKRRHGAKWIRPICEVRIGKSGGPTQAHPYFTGVDFPPD